VAVESLRPTWRSHGARQHSEPIDWPFLVGNSDEVRAVVRFLGLLSLDSNSYLARNPRWRPTLPGRRRGTFGIRSTP
jgi:hypothetical protein